MRVLLIDDHALFRAGVGLLLRESYPDIEIVEAETLVEGIAEALRQPLNIVFLDLGLPDGYGFDALSELRRQRPSLPVVVMSADESADTIQGAVERHAMGFVPKSQRPDVLRAALQAALAGGVFLPTSVVDRVGREIPPRNPWQLRKCPENTTDQLPCVSNNRELGLTPREFDTLRWLVQGLPTKSIATRMGLEDITVRKYVSQLLAHFNVKRRTELIVLLAKSQICLGAPPPSHPEKGTSWETPQ